MSSVSYDDFTGTGAENYQRYFVPAIAAPVSTTLLDAANLEPGDRVLDVACGTGVIARLAAEQVGPSGSVIGIDVAPDMIAVAEAAPAPAGAPIEWRVADAAALPVADGSVDVALCQMGLMFMADRLGAVAEMRRVLAPGGRLVLNTPGTIQPPMEILEGAIVDHIAPELGGFVRAVFSLNDPDAVAGLLRDAGLSDVSATTATVTLRLPDPAAFLWQYVNVTPMGPFVAQAPEAARAALERQVVERSQPYVVDGTLRVEQPVVVAIGRA